VKRWDYFSAAPERWRTDAVSRARLVAAQHSSDPLSYAEKRVRLAKFGTFERRRWKYIHLLLMRRSAE
jgi:hypothetical protein